MKSKIVTIAESGRNQWKDKELVKHFVLFEDGQTGTLTTGFDDSPVPTVGEELEFTIEDNGFGKEVKLPKKAFKGGGGARQWTPEQVAQQDAVKLTQSYIQGGHDLKYWKQFFVETKEFMIAQIKNEVATQEVQVDFPEHLKKKESHNDLPFN